MGISQDVGDRDSEVELVEEEQTLVDEDMPPIGDVVETEVEDQAL